MNGQTEITHWYIHADLDAFFASVEQLDNPELRGKPVIVGGKPEDRRGVVSTASYEARAFGVHSAMPVFQAHRLCPQGIFVHGRMQRYAELSFQIMNIFRDYSPDVDQMSIDEAFIDLTGTEKLFGPPEETAKKIKERVKEETGLTISIGLATTKYLAKICSGLSKPDGFYHLKKGNEQSFMLNLPLNKVWGLGPKSLDLIHNKGFRTTRELFEQPQETLEFLFGKNMSTFLYKVLRGIENESFSREAKSHSISAETTFPYDLTDIYTIETELLELSHGVFFRLLKEQGYSRTAFVKIRYDDFTTCTVQETVERNIITLDSFFEIIKKLFEKRYENGRGIRLLGVGFENITKEEKPYQQDLFTNNKDEKKQAVEKAILNLSQKHPEIKVRKARTLKAVLLAAIITLAPAKTYTQSPVELPAEAPDSLFDYQLNDENHVDFYANGHWETEFSSGLNYSFGNGTESVLSPSVPVFKQDVELSAKFTINDSWFFLGEFADEFKKNTIAIGYEGTDLVRLAKLSNRSIIMPQGYSSEYFGYALQGGDNQAPGFQLNLAGEKWLADFFIRYDMTTAHSATWYGNCSVIETKTDIKDFIYGREFHFPQEVIFELLQIENVFIESKKGTFYDNEGTSFKKLSNDEYQIIAVRNRLYISQSSGGNKNEHDEIPKILITFTDDSYCDEIIKNSGSYNQKESFFGKIQNEFNQNDSSTQIDLEKYTYNLKSKINGKTALIIQNSKGFSPYLCSNTYLASYSTKKQKNESFSSSVISKETELTQTQFSTVTSDELYTSVYEDFFYENQQTVTVINNQTPETLYPFAKIAPEIYFNAPEETELSILIQNYSPVNEFVISKEASGGTVQVYKNGILQKNTSFNSSTGVVTFSETVSDSDKIIITWQEEVEDYTKGSLAAGAGFKYEIRENLKADINILTLIPLNLDKKAKKQKSESQTGFTAVSGGLEYTQGNLKLTERTSFAAEKENHSSESNFNTSLKNFTSAEYKNSNSILKIKDFDLIKDFSFEAQSVQSAQNLSKPDFFFNSTAKTEITAAGIKLNGSFSHENQKINNISHEIKTDNTLQKFFNAGDIYHFDASSKELRKENDFSILIPVRQVNLKTGLKALAKTTMLQIEQNSKVFFEYNQKNNMAEAGFYANLTVSQTALSDFTQNETLQAYSYFPQWQKMTTLEFSPGLNTASKRSTTLDATLFGTIPFPKEIILRPKLIFEANGSYKSAVFETLFTDKTNIALKLPFSAKNISLSFELSRNGGSTTVSQKGGTYLTDGRTVLENQKDRQWLYTQPPFYELFDKKLSAKVSADYGAKYELIFKRNIFNSLKDLYIPSAASFSVTRDIRKNITTNESELWKNTKSKDIYQFKTVITNTSINNFGSNSKTRLFSCFSGDELVSSLSTILRLPSENPEDYKLRITAFIQMILITGAKSNLTDTFELNYDNEPDWNAKNTISFTRLSETSLLTEIAAFMFPQTKDAKYSISRKDTATIDFGKQEGNFIQKYEYLHKVTVSFREHYSINGGIGATLKMNKKYADTFALNILLEAKAEF